MSYDEAWRRLREQQAATPAGHGLPLFDGLTLQADDEPRLSGLLDRVYHALQDGQWHTLADLSATTGGSEGGVGARIRDLRKEKFGGHNIPGRHRGGGVWEWRLVTERQAA